MQNNKLIYDSFKLKNAYDIFDKNTIAEEMEVIKENSIKRTTGNINNENADGLYYSGKDVRGNKFKDHQLPKKGI